MSLRANVDRLARAGALPLLLALIVTPSPAGSAARPRPPRHDACCRVPAGTPVKVELVDQVSSAVQKPGDTFALRLGAPLIVDGRVVLRAGTPGVGQVIESAGPRIGGKAAKVVLAASYLTTARARVPLNGLQLARSGRDRSKVSQGLGVAGLAVAPLGVVGIVMPGGDVVIPSGAVGAAKVASAVTLPPLGRATPQEIAASASVAQDAAREAQGPIAIPPPPQGQGQVVFFRPKSRLSVGEWFNVREGGQVLGKLTNGAYFVQVTPPGVHTYTAKLEPELKDHLTINVDSGETYFIEGAVTGGLVIGAANLSPSTRESFNKAAKALKPAGSPEGGQASAQSPPK
jgi:hypothetical protein